MRMITADRSYRRGNRADRTLVWVARVLKRRNLLTRIRGGWLNPLFRSLRLDRALQDRALRLKTPRLSVSVTLYGPPLAEEGRCQRV